VISLADLDESTPYRDQLQDTSTPVTIINTFVAPEGQIDEVLAAWTHDAEYMKSKPGFISAQLYRGIADSRVITNIAVWESAEHLSAAFGTPEFAQHMARYPEGTVAYPHLYQKAAVKGVCAGEAAFR
jgi:heme-degrading monooxygenase HmoA